MIRLLFAFLATLTLSAQNVTFTDGLNRSTVTLDLATGEWSWTILQAPRNGQTFTGESNRWVMNPWEIPWSPKVSPKVLYFANPASIPQFKQDPARIAITVDGDTAQGRLTIGRTEVYYLQDPGL